MAETFRFESLLKVRESERNERRNEYLDAEERRAEAERAVAEIDARLVETGASERAALAEGRITPGDLQRARLYRNRLLEERAAAVAELDARAEEVAARQAELSEAVKEVRILETLKEKSAERAADEAQRRSAKELDELATQQKTQELRRNSPDK